MTDLRSRPRKVDSACGSMVPVDLLCSISALRAEIEHDEKEKYRSAEGKNSRLHKSCQSSQFHLIKEAYQDQASDPKSKANPFDTLDI